MIIEKIVIKKINACNRMNFSSNVNEFLRTVLNSFFYKKILHAPKEPKASKVPKAQRRIQAKAQNATSEQK